MSEIHAIAIITPAPGKIERVKELLGSLAEKVKSGEPGVSQYHFYEQVNSEGNNVIVAEETYKDQATFDAHHTTPWFTELVKIVPEETLFAAPLDVKILKPFAGFSSR